MATEAVAMDRETTDWVVEGARAQARKAMAEAGEKGRENADKVVVAMEPVTLVRVEEVAARVA